jgi:hypothetical protein
MACREYAVAEETSATGRPPPITNARQTESPDVPPTGPDEWVRIKARPQIRVAGTRSLA